MSAGSRPAPRQCAAAVLMVRPAAFAANPETAATNAFQRPGPVTAGARDAARAEFDSLAAALDAAGVEVIVLGDQPEPVAPDAVFPNNWVSFHHDGRAVLYPMLSPLRRLERRTDAIPAVAARGYECRGIVDLTPWERDGRFLEGTGSMVLDHAARIAYACESPRSCREPLGAFCDALGYAPCVFAATGPAGEPLYHTNVMMCIGEGFVSVCLDAVPDAAERRALADGLLASGRELVRIRREQMNSFAGNMLALATAGAGRVIALSAAAWASLDRAQRAVLERHGSIVAVAVPTIECLGGGSVRCMLAEVFLPRGARPGATAIGAG